MQFFPPSSKWFIGRTGRVGRIWVYQDFVWLTTALTLTKICIPHASGWCNTNFCWLQKATSLIFSLFRLTFQCVLCHTVNKTSLVCVCSNHSSVIKCQCTAIHPSLLHWLFSWLCHLLKLSGEQQKKQKQNTFTYLIMSCMAVQVGQQLIIWKSTFLTNVCIIISYKTAEEA